MRLLHANHIHYSIADRTLLHINELSINKGDRIGLIGRNGQGKTLLLHYLLGKTEASAKVKLYSRVASFDQLDLNREDLNWDRLSGGEKTLQKLEELFSKEADLLFLDEPTNNLDWQQIEKLEHRLLTCKSSYVIVSHDRELLNQVCSTIWELDEGEISKYKGNFSSYEKAKKIEINQQQEAYEKYTKEKKRLTERVHQKEQQSKGMNKPPSRMGNSEWQLHKGKAKGQQQKIQRVTKVMQERLERLERVEKPFEWADLIMTNHSTEPISNKHILSAQNLSANIASTLLYRIDRLSLKTGSKTALLGSNGSGKTTLLKQLLADSDYVTMSKQARVGYFAQVIEELPQDQTILQYVKQDSLLSEHIIRTILGRLRFLREDVNKPIRVLSGGERAKTAIAKLLSGQFNVLILDEPTNHLDIEAITALEQLINDFPGTVLYVSHDRRFVEQTATNLWLLENHTINVFEGTYNQWTERNSKASAPEEEQYDLMKLETKLSEIISRLSTLNTGEDKSELEQEYQNTLRKIQYIKQD
ncbi:ABC-F family ATP-binding cassette domain-containing protein [Pontibacillus sp. ALD_SL1]|uniref:ribosomal protection-like ABC-F family protein n=1 Tax=Pontibacillus sp. ALD_SL1 TaxID=2777185 RepID=UPI001A97CD27|nr:ABC-F family ATP-binding cassette domain-containing protein [Pontibacillus sp. ALD_SL1]QST00555.1 ABC-F family ATP-binding cassette domain-containing protein [Pontibacillus sp. ALD_SL1]